jgi:cytochrome c5
METVPGRTSHDEGKRVNLIKKILVAQAAVLALMAAGAQATTNDDIAKRLEPVGKVCVQGKECEGVGAVASAGGGGAPRSGEEIVGKVCTTCHGTGLLGAPKVGDKGEWGKRAKEQGGLDGLLAKAISGINAMPPKGTCADCSDDELTAAIKHMSGL